MNAIRCWIDLFTRHSAGTAEYLDLNGLQVVGRSGSGERWFGKRSYNSIYSVQLLFVEDDG
jgi:hypothetical protein